jgi:hypothetical protein
MINISIEMMNSVTLAMTLRLYRREVPRRKLLDWPVAS